MKKLARGYHGEMIAERLYKRYGVTIEAEEIDVSPPMPADEVVPIG